MPRLHPAARLQLPKLLINAPVAARPSMPLPVLRARDPEPTPPSQSPCLPRVPRPQGSSAWRRVPARPACPPLRPRLAATFAQPQRPNAPAAAAPQHSWPLRCRPVWRPAPPQFRPAWLPAQLPASPPAWGCPVRAPPALAARCPALWPAVRSPSGPAYPGTPAPPMCPVPLRRAHHPWAAHPPLPPAVRRTQAWSSLEWMQ